MFLDSYENFKVKCKEEDPDGFELLFPDDIEENYHQMSSSLDRNDEIKQFQNNQNEEHISSEEDELNEEIEYISKDPVRKYQFQYNKSLCLTNKYPEIEVIDHTKEIIIAPGEGQRPYDITKDIDWDIKTFPQLHNLDGSNGKDEERQTKLSDQSYFIQRILNKDQRFAKCPTYILAT